MSKQLLCELHFAMPTTLLSRVLSVHHKLQFTLTTCARCTIVLPHLTIVIFNKIFNTNRKCPAKLFAAAKPCNIYTICPSFCSSYCSHSWPQDCCMGHDKSLHTYSKPRNNLINITGWKVSCGSRSLLSRKLYIVC